MSVITHYLFVLGFTNTKCSQSTAGLSADKWHKQDFTSHD